MKTVILAGGRGTRISEESHLKPKPMIAIGDSPILVHIMDIYAAHGFNDFVVLAGYKQQVIKEYFANFAVYANDVTFDLVNDTTTIHGKAKRDWKITVTDTGELTQTGGRVLRAKDYIGEDEPFFLTYGDAVGDVDIKAILESHRESGKLATITVYNFGQSKGVVEIGENGSVLSFREKSNLDGDLINAGFMVLEPEIFSLIKGDETTLESALKELADRGQLNAYVHHGFWQCMDTIREKEYLEELYQSGHCPWKVW